MRAPISFASLIGDVVASKTHPDRAHLQDVLVAALRRVDELVPSTQHLEVTIGDEFQGAYATVADATLAALLVRLELLPAVDTRYGLGWGSMTLFDPERQPLSQDGPAWWAARNAIAEVKERSRQPRSRSLRTWVSIGDPGAAAATPPAAFVNSFLLCRDSTIARMSERGVRLLRGLMAGQPQSAIADSEGITQSAVSQQLSRSGAYAVRDAHDVLSRATS
jgi:hypothetical protein